MNERLVQSKLEYLVNLPEANGWAVLEGSPKQVAWAEKIRSRKLSSDWLGLPVNITDAIESIADSCWWITNADCKTDQIKWPFSWVTTANTTVNRSCPPKTLDQTFIAERTHFPSSRNENKNELPEFRPEDIHEFELFARKASQSPELAYLVMMAFLYRMTKDNAAFSFYEDALSNINGHLAAIKKITGL